MTLQKYDTIAFLYLFYYTVRPRSPPRSPFPHILYDTGRGTASVKLSVYYKCYCRRAPAVYSRSPPRSPDRPPLPMGPGHGYLTFSSFTETFLMPCPYHPYFFCLIFGEPDRPLQIIPVQEAIGFQNGCRAICTLSAATGI
ncbi:MAG: hypothetical protein AB4352_13415 [Hormoscilla sp.]